MKLAEGLSPKLYSKQVLFKDQKSGQMFRVIQRNDIDPNCVITYGPNKEKTNLEAILKENAPHTSSGKVVKLIM